MSRAAKFLLPAALVCGAFLAACSDVYYARRDTITFHAGDDVAANRVTHAVDMWPREAGYRDYVANGEKIQGAIERYRTNKVTPPVGLNTSAISPTQSAAPPSP